MAIGVIAESLEQLGPAHAARHCDSLMPVVLRALTHPLHESAGGEEPPDDEVEQLVQNSAYCAGVLAAPGGDAALRHMQPLLTALQPLLHRSGDAVPHRLVDNALGATARAVRGSAAHLPLDQIVPVAVAALPIREDYRENDVTLRTLMGVFGDGVMGPALAPHREAFVRMLTGVVHAHDAALAERATRPSPVRDDDDEDEADAEQKDPLTPELRADVIAWLQAAGAGSAGQ